jgi:predicted transcriptional regulator
MSTTQLPITNANVIRELRRLMPARAVTLTEAYAVSEQQAARLLSAMHIRSVPVDLNRLADLPRLKVMSQPRHVMPTLAGFTEWRDGQYVVVINRTNNLYRRRFTFAHELKHVIDWTARKTAYGRLGGDEARRDRQIERICDYFAACLLMPRPAIKRHWYQGYQDIEALAQLYGVSLEAMTIRLKYLGLVEDTNQRLFRRDVPVFAELLTPSLTITA